MKGILLAGGVGSRLLPLTSSISKHLLAVYDKPMIFYPLSILMSLLIRNIAIVINKNQINQYKSCLGNGSHLGLNIQYIIQNIANGTAGAIKQSEKFISEEPFIAILGDNLFICNDISILNVKNFTSGAHVFCYRVKNPEQFGVINFNENNQITTIEEKPKLPRSNWAIVGLGYYDSQIFRHIKKINKSLRGEYEITDVIKSYSTLNKLHVSMLPDEVMWSDMGTPESLFLASQEIRNVELSSGRKIGCIEEIAYKNGWITKKNMQYLASKYNNSSYGVYLQHILN